MPAPALVSVVDDDESVRESLPDLLKEFGFAAMTFASGETYLKSPYVKKTKCLILDVAMPGMSGPDVKRALSERGVRIPIIFITARADSLDAEARKGAVACLLKPFNDTELLESIEALLRHEEFPVTIFETAQAFLAHPKPAVPSCLVLDVHLPDLNGLDLQRRLADDGSEMPIVFLTGYGDIPMSVRAMKAGATEFLTKPFDNDVLLTAVQNALARSQASFARDSENRNLKARFDSLSDRERSVMTLVVKGLLNKQVGGELGISEITVKAHRGRAMQKMQARSFADLVKMASQLGITPPPAT
jgi:FixJ family two-component response regulator